MGSSLSKVFGQSPIFLGHPPLRTRTSFAHDTQGAPHHAGGMGVRLGGSGWAAAFGTHG